MDEYARNHVCWEQLKDKTDGMGKSTGNLKAFREVVGPSVARRAHGDYQGDLPVVKKARSGRIFRSFRLTQFLSVSVPKPLRF